jgi:hypothetical protein
VGAEEFGLERQIPSVYAQYHLGIKIVGQKMQRECRRQC